MITGLNTAHQLVRTFSTTLLVVSWSEGLLNIKYFHENSLYILHKIRTIHFNIVNSFLANREGRVVTVGLRVLDEKQGGTDGQMLGVEVLVEAHD